MGIPGIISDNTPDHYTAADFPHAIAMGSLPGICRRLAGIACGIYKIQFTGSRKIPGILFPLEDSFYRTCQIFSISTCNISQDFRFLPDTFPPLGGISRYI